ncbi:MAG: chemotaxis protein CheW [Veillonellales bacterium]
MATEQLVAFQLATEEYAVSISHVREIIKYNGATKLPNTPEYMEGMINLRGKIIPVIDLAAKFELQLENPSKKQALIVEMTGQEMGIVVDMVTEVIRLEDNAIESIKRIADSNEFIKAIGKREDRLLIILDLDKLFNSEEMKMIRDVA